MLCHLIDISVLISVSYFPIGDKREGDRFLFILYGGSSDPHSKAGNREPGV
jgi:hypothetical protein